MTSGKYVLLKILFTCKIECHKPAEQSVKRLVLSPEKEKHLEEGLLSS